MLTAKRVHEIFTDCLFTIEDDFSITVEGIITNYKFSTNKLNFYNNEIYNLLLELPEQFQENIGGGWTFLNACYDKNNKQWGEHIDMERLFVLGIGIKKVESLLPREMWNILPGGVPYYKILN